MRRIAGLLLFFVIAAVSILPVVNSAAGGPIPGLSTNVVAAFNLVAWSLVIAMLLARSEQHLLAQKVARSLGLETRFRSPETLIRAVLGEIERKLAALEGNLVERRISSKEELSRALERVVALAFRLLDAESAELALFDRESGQYHSSFVLGKPFRSSAQAMLSGALEGEEQPIPPDVLVQPIAFAGTVLGSLRVALKRNRLPSNADLEIARLLALQGGLVMVSAQYTDELLRMKRASEETVKAKTGFLANLSHEIRGPLGIIINAVELVADGLCGPVSSDQLETLRMVRTNGEHLLELINDVLDYAKIESGRVNPQPVDILVNDLLTDIGNVVRTQADAKRHTLTVRQGDELLACRCDRRHVRQMLINLLTNAIKYTPDGGTIELWAERAPNNRIKLNVRDSGVGIAEEDRAKVFSAFERIEHAYSSKQVGTGLGMSLTKRLAELNGGVIDFSSAPGEGSHFWILLPTGVTQRAGMQNTQEEQQAPRGNGEILLLVQQDRGERSMLTRYLLSLGYTVRSCASSAEAQEVLERNKVQIAVIDNDVVDNPEEGVVQLLRSGSSPASIPIVLLSSRAFVFDIEKYLRAGVDRCLSKPLELRDLARTCRELLTAPALPGEGEGSSGQSKDQPGTKVISVDDLVH